MLRTLNERISLEEGLRLLRETDTAELIARAGQVRRHKPHRNIYYVHSLNLNPTNICENPCGLCAFWRENEAEQSGFHDLNLTRQLYDRILEALRATGNETTASREENPQRIEVPANVPTGP